MPPRRRPSPPEALPAQRVYRWDSGTVVIFCAVPFPFRRKPFVPSRLERDAVVRAVPLRALYASQREVTDHGVRQYVGARGGELPLVYDEGDGTYTIGDGHHRLTAAWLRLRPDTRVRVRVVAVPRANPAKIPFSRATPPPLPPGENPRNDDTTVAHYRDVAREVVRQMWSRAGANAVVRANEADGVAKFLRYVAGFARDYLAWQLLATTLDEMPSVGRFRARAGTYDPGTGAAPRTFRTIDQPTRFAVRRREHEALARATEAYFDGLAAHVAGDREAAGWRAVNALGDRGATARDVASLVMSAARKLEEVRDELGQEPEPTLREQIDKVDDAAKELARALNRLGFGAAASVLRSLNGRDVSITLGADGRPDARLHVRRAAGGPIRRVKKAAP